MRPAAVIKETFSAAAKPIDTLTANTRRHGSPSRENPMPPSGNRPARAQKSWQHLRWPEHLLKRYGAVNRRTRPRTHSRQSGWASGRGYASGRCPARAALGAIPARANSALRNASSKGGIVRTTRPFEPRQDRGGDLPKVGARNRRRNLITPIAPVDRPGFTSVS